jgi:hypothetical protein
MAFRGSYVNIQTNQMDYAINQPDPSGTILLSQLGHVTVSINSR